MWRYLLLALIGLPLVAVTFGFVTNAATAAFLIGFVALCLTGRAGAGPAIVAAFGPFLLLAVLSVGWSRASASVWTAQMLTSGLAFGALAALLLAR